MTWSDLFSFVFLVISVQARWIQDPRNYFDNSRQLSALSPVTLPDKYKLYDNPVIIPEKEPSSERRLSRQKSEKSLKKEATSPSSRNHAVRLSSSSSQHQAQYSKKPVSQSSSASGSEKYLIRGTKKETTKQVDNYSQRANTTKNMASYRKLRYETASRVIVDLLKFDLIK